MASDEKVFLWFAPLILQVSIDVLAYFLMPYIDDKEKFIGTSMTAFTLFIFSQTGRFVITKKSYSLLMQENIYFLKSKFSRFWVY